MMIANKDCSKNLAIEWFSNYREPVTEKDYYLSFSLEKADSNRVLIHNNKTANLNFWKDDKLNKINSRSKVYSKFKYQTIVSLWVDKNDKIPWELLAIEMLKPNKQKSVNTTTEKVSPWLLSSSQIDIIDIFEVEITGEIDNDYTIEFSDAQMEIVEATLPKKEFDEHPEPVSIGTPFGIVLYKQQGETATKIGAWPIEKYWNKSLSS